MDNNGYVFTPLVFLLFIPIMILALTFGNIVNELNMISMTAIGGDVTVTTANNVFTSIRDGAANAGKNASYNATMKIINGGFIAGFNSSDYIRNSTVDSLNANVLIACKNLEAQTGRSISINNITIDNSTTEVFSANDVSITQGKDPFTFSVNIRQGIPITVNGLNQSYQGVTPQMQNPVNIAGLEDPYVYLNTNKKTISYIYEYPYNISGTNYQFDNLTSQGQIQYLWDCMNGTDNPSGIAAQPYYFIDPYGLSFFDRLENKTNLTSNSPPVTRMSTFILRNPLSYNAQISILDHEYFNQIPGTTIYTTTGKNKDQIITPITQPTTTGPLNGLNVTFSSLYINYLGLTGNPYPY